MAITYRDAGVDIDAGDRLVERIKPLASATRTKESVEGVGGFAALCGLPSDIADPLLVSGTDGVGTKLKIAFDTGRHDTIGQDLVAMCVNDVLTTGARPLFFLDYFACSKLDVDVAEAVIRGIADGCKLAGCALLGGETAELPGMYAPGEYDLAGFAVGVVGRSKLLGAPRVAVGDAIVAVASSGLHSNGFSLARSVLQTRMGLELGSQLSTLDAPLGEVLLTPTRIYARAALELAASLGDGLHAMCHVTGGGIVGNLPRVLPGATVARIRLDHRRPAIFDIIEKGGPVEPAEMLRTFNLGIGLIVIVAADRVESTISALDRAGERGWQLGEIARHDAGGPATVEILA
jgi:phosphoribosylformylglycinamidine cyclo-ligase